MLTLTPSATQAINAILEAEQVPEGSGLRISTRGEDLDPDGRAQLELSLVEEPEADDQIVEQSGAHVFVEPTAAAILEDKQLDATLEGEQIGFRVLDQSPPPPSENGAV
jgi:iron-sulfur cluster assembly protein